MSATPAHPSGLSGDDRDLLAIYTNLRSELVKLTAAGPLVERRDKYSKLEDGERRGHEEGTQVREHIRTFFKLREILIESGLPLDLPDETSKADGDDIEDDDEQFRTGAIAAEPASRKVAPLFVTPRQIPFNPATKFTPPPLEKPAESAYATSLSSTILSPGRTTPVFNTRA